MSALVRESTIAELEDAAEFLDLLAEYCGESAIKGLPTPAAKMEMYRDFEQRRLIHVFSATVDDALVGFITVLAPELPHYSRLVAVSESFFVAQAYRNTMAGLKLLVAAEAKAHELGSPGLLVSAPFGGKLFELMPRCGYTETNRVFFKPSGALPVSRRKIAPMSETAIAKVSALEEASLATMPQIALNTDHLFHAGMYLRTMFLPAGTLLTGALIKIPTALIVVGDATVYVDGAPMELKGYNILAASAGRKQAFVARTDVHMTMTFPTTAQTVAEAEAEFTDEAARMISNRFPERNHVTVTGE